jgi:hypothetical protein
MKLKKRPGNRKGQGIELKTRYRSKGVIKRCKGLNINESKKED